MNIYEQWIKINKTNYYLSNYGNFKRLDKLKEYNIQGWIDNYGYKIVSYYENNKRKREFVHRLVAKYFGNKLNNNYKNLEWTNSKGNRIHAVSFLKVGKMKRKIGQYSLKGDFIREFESIKDAAKFHNTLHTSIFKVLKGIRKTHKNFIFKYMDEIYDKSFDKEGEQWKKVINYEELYEVSNFGRIKSIQRINNPIILK